MQKMFAPHYNGAKSSFNRVFLQRLRVELSNSLCKAFLRNENLCHLMFSIIFMALTFFRDDTLNLSHKGHFAMKTASLPKVLSRK